MGRLPLRFKICHNLAELYYCISNHLIFVSGIILVTAFFSYLHTETGMLPSYSFMTYFFICDDLILWKHFLIVSVVSAVHLGDT